MKKILVHLHLYYIDQLDYFIKKLKNIKGCEWDLFVTLVCDNESVRKKILKFKSNAQIIMVDNVGFDVWPFIQILKKVDLNEYDFVLKVHTKRILKTQLEFEDEKRNIYFGWRECLVEALLASKKRFAQNIRILADSKYGMVCNKKYLFG
jgi:lipopolysaccharide biosynthesis protein